MKYNVGCGDKKWPDFVNIDIEKSVNPDVILDIKSHRLPCDDGAADEIWMFHTLEHIEKVCWTNVFMEFNRALKVDGNLFLAYPEFTKCVDNWIKNYKGIRDYWENTIYGRQLYRGDYHIAITDSDELKQILETHGFANIKTAPEVEPNEYYSVLSCVKNHTVMSRSDVLAQELFAI